jgi:predicted GTPase
VLVDSIDALDEVLVLVTGKDRHVGMTKEYADKVIGCQVRVCLSSSAITQHSSDGL